MEPKRPTQADRNRDNLKKQRDLMQQRKEQAIDAMSPEDLLKELKAKGLPVFGTNKEKADRLKKANGITPANDKAKKGNVLNNIEAISKGREERRKKMEEEKKAKEERRAENEALGKRVDVEFQHMVVQYKRQLPARQPHVPSSNLRICVCVRKRPIFRAEETNGEIDAVSCVNPQVLVHETKFKVDGITKFLENHAYTFDNSFGEDETTESVYDSVLQPVCPFILQGGTVTCFAYGQTGSGKTFTMKGLQQMVVTDLFKLGPTARFVISFFEIYGGRCYDLLNGRNKLTILEDGAGGIQVQQLTEQAASSAKEVINLIEYGNSVRTTHSTTSNADSSRSHAICQIIIQTPTRAGKLRLVDLAGSERAQDCTSNNRQRRIEGAEINKSLLALKECIRALKSGPTAHVPYRGSKLTLVLRDSFEGGENTRVIMITCVSPGHSSSDHTLNSLRYSDRLKEQSAPNVVQQFQPRPDYRAPPPKPVERNLDRPAERNVDKPAERNVEKRAKPAPKAPVEEKFRKSFRDMEYIHEHSKEDKISNEMLDLHEKVETILAEEEEVLESHVNAIKEDAKLLTEEGELIAMAQGQSGGDYDVDAYVAQLEALVKRKLQVYQALYEKLVTFKNHLNEEEEVSHHLTQNLIKK